jgi:tetratricopeptide (TPR) repeat protein
VRLEAGQIEEALFALDRFLELEPAGTEARRERARLRERLGQHQGALLDARRLLEANPGDVQAWVLLVHSERMTRGDKAAAEASEAAIARVGRDPALIAELSTASATARPVPFGKLKEDFGDRADRWPGKLGPLMREVVSNIQRRDWAAAAALAAEAGRQHRGSWLGPWVQGVVEQAGGKLEVAEERMLEALARSPRSHRAVTNLVAIWSRQNGPLAAADRLVALVDADPGFEYPLPIAARVYLEADQPARAEATAQRALAALPRSPRPYGDLATLYLELDRPGEALQICEQGLARFQDDPELLLRQARSKAALGDREGAISVYETLLSRQPDHHLAAAELAILLVETRSDADSSRRALALVHGLELDGPLEAEALGAIGRVSLKAANDSATALRALEAAVQGAPEDPTLRYYLALARKLEGKPELAIPELRLALQLGRPFPEEPEARRLIRELEGTR